MGTRLRVVGVLLLLAGIGLAAAAYFGGGKLEGDISCRMQVKDRVMTGVYKAYGTKDCLVPMWLAKTVFTNGTNGRITHLKLKYKVGEYADWCSPHNYVAVDPGQTVVDVYHPILSSACAKLASRTPAELEMQGEYIDASGRKQEFNEIRHITLLGRHEFIFSDLTAEERTLAFQDKVSYSPLLAAWVSRQDDPISRLASAGNRRAGGLGAGEDFESCVKVMAALYQVMRDIHISYQHPQGIVDQKMSYDVKLVQSLQFPRDTIQKRSGTCIDLAILYAALLNSVNIDPFLVVLKGHTFPMGRTPGGAFIPVEVTGVRDGHDSLDFLSVFKIGKKEWDELQQSGAYFLVDVSTCWANGISNPELEPLPPDILEKWGIIKMLGEEGNEGGGGPKPPPPPPQPQIGGRWTYTVTAPNGVSTQGQFQIQTQGNQVALIAVAAYQMQGPDGQMHQFTERNDFVGTLNGNNLTAECNNAVYTMDGQRVPPQGLPLRMGLVVAADGRSMQGQVVNSMGLRAAISAQR